MEDQLNLVGLHIFTHGRWRECEVEDIAVCRRIRCVIYVANYFSALPVWTEMFGISHTGFKVTMFFYIRW